MSLERPPRHSFMGGRPRSSWCWKSTLEGSVGGELPAEGVNLLERLLCWAGWRK